MLTSRFHRRALLPVALILIAAAAEPERQPDELAAALAEIEPDSLSPREALEIVYRLKSLSRA